MTKNKTIVNLLASIACLGLVTVATPAVAGTGGSFTLIRTAANSGSETAVIAELERAEDIACTTECMSFVMGLLDHDAYRVREAAAWWFGRRAAQRRELSERSIAYLQLNDSTQARNAADILGAFGHPQAIPALSTAVTRADLSAEARAHAARALGRIRNNKANPALTTAMSDSDASVRVEALKAWRLILKQNSAAPAAQLVADGDVAVRRTASAVVGQFREASARVALETQLANDTDAATRRNAAWALGRIGDNASRDALQAATSDESPLVRYTARAALRHLR